MQYFRLLISGAKEKLISYCSIPLLILFHLLIFLHYISYYFILFPFPHTTLPLSCAIVKGILFFYMSMQNFYHIFYCGSYFFCVSLAMQYFLLRTFLLPLKMKQMFLILFFKVFGTHLTWIFLSTPNPLPHCPHLGLMNFETQAHPNLYKLQKHIIHAHFLFKWL